MNANPVDLGPVLREGVDASLKAAPVILVAPIPNERLGLLEGDALRPVAGGFPLRPPRGRQSTLEIVDRALRHRHLERLDAFGRFRKFECGRLSKCFSGTDRWAEQPARR